MREAADLIIGNLNEDGYLIASDEELLGVAPPGYSGSGRCQTAKSIASEAQALGIVEMQSRMRIPAELVDTAGSGFQKHPICSTIRTASFTFEKFRRRAEPAFSVRNGTVLPLSLRRRNRRPSRRSQPYKPNFTAPICRKPWKSSGNWILRASAAAICANVCLNQLRYHQVQLGQHKNGNGTAQVLQDAMAVVDQHLRACRTSSTKKSPRPSAVLSKRCSTALDYIRTLDPRPGLRYNKVQARLIEPDVAFVKHGDEWLVIMNDEDLPQLRLNPAYKKLVTRDGTNDKNTRDYVKERYKSAIQLIKNIEQRKQTITKVCYSIVARQQDFLERGIDFLKPMMIKEVAEEIGVHPSTVSRAVASKYAHTPQGVFELRYFFSESVQGPEGGGTSLLILKRRVKKLIEEEDPSRPLTDEQITRILQSQGIQVTRRTVAKYREDMRIPSTHQRRVKK